MFSWLSEIDALTQRQAALWDPVLDWAATALGARLATRSGVMPVLQAPDAMAHLHTTVAQLDPYRMAALHDMTALSGSLILALATAHRQLTAEYAWNLSRLDEDWQIAAWGTDDEALAVTAAKRADFHSAAAFFALCSA